MGSPFDLSVCSPFVARQQLGKHSPMAKNTPNNRRIFGLVVFNTPMSYQILGM
jgi:hypothetical protein